MLQEPTSHRLDPASGALSGATGRYEKRLRDLAGLYADAGAFEAAVAREGERVVYHVHEVRPAANHGDLIFGTTFMEPGRVGDEFFMTRGHIHARANRPETYTGESGEGVMLLESPDGEARVLALAPRVTVYVPPLWIHRSVNTGARPLVMSFCYPADSGQDYEVIARSGGMAVRVVADGDGWRAVPNAGYRRRTPAEVAAILATQDRPS
jgi:glucose-6-phosphate isomerase